MTARPIPRNSRSPGALIVNRQRRVRVAVKPLEHFLERVRESLGLSEHAVTICLLSDTAIARLNRDFRGKPGPTDVLSFPADRTQRIERNKLADLPGNGSRVAPRATNAAEGQAYLGDIAISIETARRHARRRARGLTQELRTLILHGMLHLAGCDHETDDGRMNRLERHLRRRLGVN